MMRLKSFRIQNYRSIVDTSWRNLGPDNVTGLIGQNESGKTTILESLRSFSNGEISEDILRSDGRLPEVSCCFETTPALVNKLLSEQRVPESLVSRINEFNRINLTRRWTKLNESVLELEEKILIEFFAQHTSKEEEKDKKYIELTEKIITDYSQLQVKANEIRAAISNLENKSKKNTPTEENGSLVSQVTQSLSETATRGEILVTESELEPIEAQLNGFKEKYPAAKNDKTSREKFATLIQENEETRAELIQAEASLAIAETPEQKKAAQTNYNSKKKQKNKVSDELLEAKKEANRARIIFVKTLDGSSIQESEKFIQEHLWVQNDYLAPRGLAEIFFENLPQIEFFEDYSSLLPNSIDLADLEKESKAVEGYEGVRNFLRVAGLDLSFFKQGSDRILNQRIDNLNKSITANFRDFWSQRVGKTNKIMIQFKKEHHPDSNEEKSGKPYLTFWIKDGQEILYPKQRSAGVRWFLSFYLQLQAAAKTTKERGLILLIDEPGVSLHSKAQEDVLKVFEEISQRIQVIYTTHSPYLLNFDKIYRLVAVQRADIEDDKSETQVLTAHELGAASYDTLSPLYTLIGTSFSDQNVIKKKNNVVLEEISAFYYLKSFFRLFDSKQEVHFLPATGCTNVHQLANLFLGWGLDFIVIFDDDAAGRREYKRLKEDLFFDDETKTSKALMKNDGCTGIEDTFSATDFKKYVLKNDPGEMKATNSQYLNDKNIAKGLLALNFSLSVDKGEVKFGDLEKASKDKIKELVSRIETMLTEKK